MLSIQDLDLRGKSVFLRVDYNIPLDKNDNITDDSRIKTSLPTLQYLLDQGARVIIASHLGRPKGSFKPEFSVKPVAQRLSELIHNDVIVAPDVIGDEVDKLKRELKDGQILMLENLRFYEGETNNDPSFAKKLASGIDYYVNDSFATCHRTHASIVAITDFIPKSAAGMLMKKEVDHLSQIIFQPEKPYVAILGGKKVSDKITVIESLLDKVDVLLIGGAMSYTFFGAQGLDIGKSFIEEDKKDLSLKLLEMADKKGVDLHLPIDHIAAPDIDSPEEAIHIDGFPIPSQMTALDIGPKTITAYSDQIIRAKTLFWNGPMGVFEVEEFSRGTTEIAKAVARSGAYAVIGGGESAAAVYKISVAGKISHISTGGGASLEFITNGTLPGIEVLKES